MDAHRNRAELRRGDRGAAVGTPEVRSQRTEVGSRRSDVCRPSSVVCLLTFGVCAAAAARAAAPVSFESLRRQAQERVRWPFIPAAEDLPQVLRDLDYDGYRAISYRPQRALWAGEGLPFRVEFFHRGYLFPKRVRISVLDGAAGSEVPFAPKLFDYSESAVEPGQLREDLGFAGFRLLYPIHQPDHHHEFISFLGASYFRAVAAH